MIVVASIRFHELDPEAHVIHIFLIKNNDKLCACLCCVICYVVSLGHLLSPLLMFGKVGAFAPLVSIWQLIDCEEIKVK